MITVQKEPRGHVSFLVHATMLLSACTRPLIPSAPTTTEFHYGEPHRPLMSTAHTSPGYSPPPRCNPVTDFGTNDRPQRTTNAQRPPRCKSRPFQRNIPHSLQKWQMLTSPSLVMQEIRVATGKERKKKDQRGAGSQRSKDKHLANHFPSSA